MARDVSNHCSQCHKCQISKAPVIKPVPLQSVVITRLWEMVAVDILKVPPSLTGNQNILVAQDYFSKWPFAFAMPDQNCTIAEGPCVCPCRTILRDTL